MEKQNQENRGDTSEESDAVKECSEETGMSDLEADDTDEEGAGSSDNSSEDHSGIGDNDYKKMSLVSRKKADRSADNLEPPIKIPRMEEMPRQSIEIPEVGKKDLFKPPTNKELNQLKETENLFHSSLFRLQIRELLLEVKVTDKRYRQIKEKVSSLQNLCAAFPAGEEYKISDQNWLQGKGVKVPIVQKPLIGKGQFQFFPPKKLQIFGSFNYETCVKPDVVADVFVQMPKECFQHKDYLNHRYLRKRALYLAVLAMYLSEEKMVTDVQFTYDKGNTLKPILMIKYQGTRLHLHIEPEPGAFKLNRFHINKSNIRRHWFTQSVTDTDSSITNEPPTPMYNTSILKDLTLEENLKPSRQIADSEGIREGICLLKVWLRQRELHLGSGSFDGYILTMYVLYLLSKRKLHVMMSSYQVMRNTLLNLSQSDWTTQGISLCSDTSDKLPNIAEFHAVFETVFVDATGYMNLCDRMSSTVFYRVKHEAKMAIEMLEDKIVDSFELLFMTPVHFYQKFDHMFHLSDLEQLEDYVQKLGLQDKLLDCGGDYVTTCHSAILSTLRKALGQRIKLMQIKGETQRKWSISSEPPIHSCGDILTFGLLLNTEFSSSLLDKGPSADTVKAKEFRQFWGKKSELRRFQDSSICEAVVWLPAEASIAEKRLVCSKIVQYILHSQIGIPEKCVSYVGGQLNGLLKPYLSAVKGTGEEEHTAVIQSYDSLCKILRSLSDLPLTINSIQGLSPVFRFTDVFPPVPTQHRSGIEKGNLLVPVSDKPCPLYTPVLKVLCLLESSSKWPENVEAIRRLKAAFYINLAKILKMAHSLTVRLATDHIDILKDGFVFRLIIGYLREIALLKKTYTPEGVTVQDRESSQDMERQISALPKLTSTLHGLYQRHSTYSGTARLAKRWISSQLLSDHISDEAVDLIVTSLFLHPYPFTPPSSVMVGFLRFLHLLSTFDWKMSPLMVNLNDEFNKIDFTDIRMRFSKERSTLPLMFISTPQDKLSSHWTKKSPSAPILLRLVLLARESLQVLQNEMSGCHSDLTQIFRPPLDAYDIILHLKPNQLARGSQYVDFKRNADYKQKKPVESTIFPVTDYDPVQLYLKELRVSYEDFALFFHDRFGGDIIGVLWKPSAFQQKEFKVSNLKGRKPIIEGVGVHLVPDVDAIIEDFHILGGGLLTKIEKKSEHWQI